MSSTAEFTGRVFNEKLPDHAKLERVDYEKIDLDDPKYNWTYFGREKYGRYAVCTNTHVKRGLTMGEFYGSSAVD